MSVIDTLIFDRAESDITELHTLKDKGFVNMTTEEQTKWNAGMKGTYNISDINRVNAAVTYLQQLLQDCGYHVTISVGTDLTNSDLYNETYCLNYLANIQNLIDGYFTMTETPSLPATTEDILTLTGANAIEKILHDIDYIIENMQAYYIHSGVATAGQDRVWQNRFRRVI